MAPYGNLYESLKKEDTMSREKRQKKRLDLTWYSASNQKLPQFLPSVDASQVSIAGWRLQTGEWRLESRDWRGGQHWPAGPIPSKYFVFFFFFFSFGQSVPQSLNNFLPDSRGSRGSSSFDWGCHIISATLASWAHPVRLESDVPAGSQTGHTHTHAHAEITLRKIGKLVLKYAKRVRERERGRGKQAEQICMLRCRGTWFGATLPRAMHTKEAGKRAGQRERERREGGSEEDWDASLVSFRF